MANVKTNAMRILDKAGVAYNTYTYDCSDGLIDGVSVAEKTGRPVGGKAALLRLTHGRAESVAVR